MKYEELIKISDPEIVFKKFKHNNPTIKIEISNLKTKKYMIRHPITNKKIHFGSTMSDYTKHKDEKRLKNFQSRNHKWKTMDKYSPAYLSYWYLW